MKAVIFCCLVCLPLKQLHITSPFGWRKHPITGRYAFHNGADLRASYDTVYAVMDGIIQNTGYEEHLGRYVRIATGDLCAVYGHLSHLLVSQGERVFAGEPVAISGATGWVTAGHLHFSMTCRGRYIDPLQFLFQMLIQQEHEQKFQTTVHPGR